MTTKLEANISKKSNLLTALNERREERKFLQYKYNLLSSARIIKRYRLRQRIKALDARISNLELDIELAKNTNVNLLRKA